MSHLQHDQEAQACFASHGTFGVLDLGASKTVIGSDGVKDLIQQLDVETRSRLPAGSLSASETRQHSAVVMHW